MTTVYDAFMKWERMYDALRLAHDAVCEAIEQVCYSDDEEYGELALMCEQSRKILIELSARD